MRALEKRSVQIKQKSQRCVREEGPWSQSAGVRGHWGRFGSRDWTRLPVGGVPGGGEWEPQLRIRLKSDQQDVNAKPRRSDLRAQVMLRH